ncbi:MAG: adenosylmethionine decarboxylase [Myxococcota bacterium]
MDTLGRHCIVELYGCDPSRLDDLEGTRRALRRATGAVGATAVGEVFHRYAPQGVTGVVLIAESHLSVHTWPEARYAAVDIFTCGGLDPHPAVGVLARALEASRAVVTETERGRVAGGNRALSVAPPEEAPAPPRVTTLHAPFLTPPAGDKPPQEPTKRGS